MGSGLNPFACASGYEEFTELNVKFNIARPHDK